MCQGVHVYIQTLRDVERFVVPQSIVAGTQDTLRQFGRDRTEGLVLWCGYLEKNLATVSHFVVPPQQTIDEDDGVGYFVTSSTLFELNKMLDKAGLRLLAQVHSHPNQAFHSRTDDKYAIVTADGGLSLVVPNFASGPADIRTWAIFQLQGSLWCQLSSNEVQRLVFVEPTK
jgi:hypothetical protein